MSWKSIADKIKRAAKGIPKVKTNEAINKELDDLLNATNEKIINKTKDIIENQVPKVMGTDNIKNTVNIVKRRKGNKQRYPAKSKENNISIQKEPLLLDAPKPKQAKVSSKKPITQPSYDQPIQLSGPVLQDANIKKSSPADNKRIENLNRIDEAYENGALTDQEYLEKYKTVDTVHKQEKMAEQKEKYNLDDITTEQPQIPKSEPQLKPQSDKPNISLDDFKTADEIEQMDLTDNIDIDASKIFEESDTIKESQLDKLEELHENGTLSQEDYEKAIDNVINDSNTNIEVDSPIMSESKPEVKNQPKESQSKSQQQIFNEYAEQNFKPLEANDGDLSAFGSGDGYNVTLRNARAENITLNDTNYDVLYGENGARVFRNTQTGDFVQDQQLANSLNTLGEDARNRYLTNLSDDNWDLIAGNAEKNITANPEKYGFNRAAIEGVEGYDARLMNEMDANDFRKAAAEARSKDVQKAFGQEKDKKIKKQLEDKRNKLDIEALKAQKISSARKIQLENRDLKREVGNKFNEALGLNKFEKGSAEYYEALKAAKGTAAYEEAVKDLRKQMGNISKSKEFAIKNSNKVLDSQIKGLMGKGMTIGKAITIGTAAMTAIDKYKESKAEGRSTASSLIRAGGAAAIGEVLGPGGFVALTAAQLAPKAIIGGADALYKEHRRMNSASNFVPLGGVNFQDSQELATMRQSGMELAKMSQYNLEQTLMGAEAKHLHR